MGLKDDFLEALNSVKKDIFNGSDDADPDNEKRAGNSTQSSASGLSTSSSKPTYNLPEDEIAPPPMDDSAVFDAFKKSSVIDDAAFDDMSGLGDLSDDFGESIGKDFYAPSASSSAPPPFVNYAPEPEVSSASESFVSGPPSVSSYSSSSRMYDFDRTDLYSDDKTIISKNTVIRGALQTDDSIRLLGQVLGDIDCKSNIVVAGKVRGNTSAANAYIMDAQVDGSLQCEDVCSVSSDAWVLGDIRAQQAEIDGKIKGNLDIRHAISIGSTSSIIGNISTDELEIKRGAFINGQVMMYTPSRDVLDRFDQFEK